MEGETESSPASNETKKIKTDKVKVKTEDLNFHSVSKPRIRKKVDKVMKKYYKNEFYTQLDLAKKILKNLGFEATTSKQCTIRKYMLRWIKAREEIDQDSKKGIIEKVEPEAILVLNVSSIEEKNNKKDGKNEGTEREVEQINKELNKDTTKEVSQSATSSQDPKESTCKEKLIPLIDLTIDDEEIKKEEVIVLDDDEENEVNNIQINNEESNTQTNNNELSYEQFLQNFFKSLINSTIIHQPIQQPICNPVFNENPYILGNVPAFPNSYIPYNPYPNLNNNYLLYDLNNTAHYQMYNQQAISTNDAISYPSFAPQNTAHYQMYNQPMSTKDGISYLPPAPQNTAQYQMYNQPMSTTDGISYLPPAPQNTARYQMYNQPMSTNDEISYPSPPPPLPPPENTQN